MLPTRTTSSQPPTLASWEGDAAVSEQPRHVTETPAKADHLDSELEHLSVLRSWAAGVLGNDKSAAERKLAQDHHEHSNGQRGEGGGGGRGVGAQGGVRHGHQRLEQRPHAATAI